MVKQGSGVCNPNFSGLPQAKIPFPQVFKYPPSKVTIKLSLLCLCIPIHSSLLQPSCTTAPPLSATAHLCTPLIHSSYVHPPIHSSPFPAHSSILHIISIVHLGTTHPEYTCPPPINISPVHSSNHSFHPQSTTHLCTPIHSLSVPLLHFTSALPSKLPPIHSSHFCQLLHFPRSPICTNPPPFST